MAEPGFCTAEYAQSLGRPTIPAMALTLRSLATAAKRRAQLAHVHVEQARHELAAANQELDDAIPTGDVSRIRGAHERTQEAEREVTEASEELEVVGELLSDGSEPERPGEQGAPGQGVRSLAKLLRQGRP